jgi:hypothetical protein
MRGAKKGLRRNRGILGWHFIGEAAAAGALECPNKCVRRMGRGIPEMAHRPAGQQFCAGVPTDRAWGIS